MGEWKKAFYAILHRVRQILLEQEGRDWIIRNLEEKIAH
jgi:hypothetical protein